MGGKSRKKGGISKKLVKQLMAQYKDKCNGSKVSQQVKTLFDMNDENESIPKKTGSTKD